MRILHIEEDSSDSLLIQRKLVSTYPFLEYLRIQKQDILKDSIISFKPDIILSDNKVNGCPFTVIYQTFKDSWFNCPFILVTNSVSEDFAVEVLKKGVDDYIFKNQLDRLQKVIDDLLLRYQLLLERDEYINQIIESETKYKDLLYSSNEIIISTDINGIINFVNKSWQQHLGYPNTVVINKSILDYISKPSKSYGKSIFQKIKMGIKVEDVKVSMISFEDEIIDLHGVAIPHFYRNTIIGAHIFLRDTSINEKIQIELKESEKRYALAISATSDGIFDLNVKSKKFYLSENYFKILGQTPTLITQANLASILPNDFYNWLKRPKKFNAKGSKNSIFDQDIEISSNPSKWVNIKAVFNHADSRINGSVRDITDKKIQEIKIQNFNKYLENNINLKTKELKNAISLLSNKNKEVLESIHYAKRIHDALTTHLFKFEEIFPNSFILNQPKDVIGGDFAWHQQVNNTKFIAAADCTGHGVPGALLSVVATILLDEAVLNKRLNNPSKILEFVNERLITLLNHENENYTDGMDIAICAINSNCKQILFSGANRPLYYLGNGILTILNGDKRSLGENSKSSIFSLQTISYASNDQIFLHSDGITSQFGGKFGKKLKRQQLQKIVESNSSIAEKEVQISDLFIDWKGDLEQTDDILVVGITLP